MMKLIENLCTCCLLVDRVLLARLGIGVFRCSSHATAYGSLLRRLYLSNYPVWRARRRGALTAMGGGGRRGLS